MTECLFCKIVAGEIPSTPVAQSETSLAIRDIDPQAPVHVLVIPKAHVTSADHVPPRPRRRRRRSGAAGTTRGRDREGVRESGYRLVMNVGADAQMSVAHLHLHVLGGRKMEWPPG